MQAPGAAPQGFGAPWLLRLRLDTPGEVFTFYSYKGGTGRSMGMVNCAGLIAQHLPAGAKPLLLIDFDLEAPGLHRYLAPCLVNRPEAPGGGVLELFSDLSQRIDDALLASGAAALDDAAVVQLLAAFDLAPYIATVPLPGASASAPPALQLIQAGRFDAGYDQRLARFDWPRLFARAPALFRALSERLSLAHSFVFIDSRTGLSDTSGICTMLLPDALVMVFTPNNQSLTGIEHLVRQALAYRETAADGRPLRVYPLASRVDNQVEHFRRVWRLGEAAHPLFGTVTGYQPLFQALFEQTLAAGDAALAGGLGEYFDQVQVPHAADYAFGERLCFGPQSSNDSLSIRGAYELFLPWLVTGAQPWQRPAERLLDLQARLWLQESGAGQAPDDDGGWPAWFDRLARVTASSEFGSLPLAAVDAERRFDIALAQSLALAHVGDYAAARSALDVAAAAYDDDTAPSLVRQAPAELMRLWQQDPVWTKSKPDLAAWLDALDRLMARWQSLKADRREWLAALLPVARAGALHELVWRATTELEGETSDAALEALLALAQAREALDDLAGALRLVERGIELAGAARQAGDPTLHRLQADHKQLASRVQRGAARPLPALRDCESTAYISCAQDDNITWFDWVDHFSGELDRGLRALMRGVRLPPLQRSPTAGLVARAAPDETLQRVTQAFALIVVAGEHLAQSEWGQREVQAFVDTYGAAALDRIYIVALTKSAAERVLDWPVWRGITVQGAQLYLPFYDERDTERPVDIYMAPGLVARAFRDPFERLRGQFAQQLKASAQTVVAPAAAAPSPVVPAAPVRASSEPAAAAATVYIESNRNERELWESLGELLHSRWPAVCARFGAGPRPLRVRGLPIEHLAASPVLDDASGVVLLWGRKEAGALLAQVDAVESKLAGDRVCPGLIAHLSPPQPPSSDAISAHGWRVLRFVVHDEAEGALDVVPDDADLLDRFLRQVLAFATARTL